MLFLDSWLTEVGILFLTALTCFYIHYRRNVATFWAKQGIPHLKPNFLFGNALNVILTKALNTFAEDFYNENKDKRVCGLWLFHSPVLVVMDREIIKKILVRDFSSFRDRITMEVGDHDPLIRENLFNLTGHAWRNMRVKMTPTFTSGKMKMMFPTMTQTGKVLNDFLKKSTAETETSVLDMRDISARFTINMIASIAFGIEVNALENPNSDFRVLGKRVFEPTSIQVLMNMFTFLFPSLGKLIKISQLPRILTKFFVSTVKETMEYRKANDIIRKDFMQLLMELMEKGKLDDVDRDAAEANSIDAPQDTKFSLNEAAAQAFLFFSAGFETSSYTMTQALFEIAKQPEVQKRLKEEIQSAYERNDGEITYEALMKIEYLDWVVQETLRLHPAVSVLLRETSKDYLLEDLNATIPKKTIVVIPAVGTVHDEALFPNPTKFDPLRFSPERKHEIPAYAHMPFGEGPRSCIGNRFGLLQTKVGLCSILKNFTVQPCDASPNDVHYDIKSYTTNIVDRRPLKIVKDSEA